MTALAEAATLIETVRGERMLAGDHLTADRLFELYRLIAEEAEVVDLIEHHELPAPTVWYPAGAALGHLFQSCAVTRRIRELRGLPCHYTPTAVDVECGAFPTADTFADTDPGWVFV